MLQHECKKCKTVFTKTVGWLDSALFSNPKKARSIIAFLCPKEECSAPTVLQLDHLPENQVRVRAVLPTSTVYELPGKRKADEGTP